MRKHAPFITFYLIFMVVGFSIFPDYGVSWDESECRIDNGILNTNFISTHDEKPLLESISKYHGAAFEMFLVEIEKSIGLTSTHDIFLMRHVVTFLLFALSVFFFYLLCLKAFGSNWFALTGCLFLVLFPRIFADSFYNSKDLPFTSFIIISIYFSLLFLERKSVWSALLAATSSGIMIDIRIMGVLIPALVLILLFFQFIHDKSQRRKIITTGFVFAIVLICFVIALWPVLWINPVKHFILAWKEYSQYPWEGSVLYMGKIIKAVDLPWHYIPLWIAITVPPLYLALFAVGIVVIIRKVISKGSLSVIEKFAGYIVVIPIASVLILDSVVYDGWRHMYFIYPAMVILIVGGLRSIYLLCGKYRVFIPASLGAYFTMIIFTMAELHPFENTYFNVFAKQWNINKAFEVDYWALSYKQGFEYILKNDTSSDITVYLGEPQPGTDNMLFLPQRDRERFTITDRPELADFFLTCHRYIRDIKDFPGVYRIIRDGIIIHSVYDLRQIKIHLDQKNLIETHTNDYENAVGYVNQFRVVQDSSQNHYVQIGSENKYAEGFSFLPSEGATIYSPGKKYMVATVELRSAKPFRTSIVVQVDSTKTYFWSSGMINNSSVNKWNSYKYICEMPVIRDTTNMIKVYLDNFEYENFYHDNFRIQIYSIDSALVNSVKKKLPL
jgi:hypothetical protein